MKVILIFSAKKEKKEKRAILSLKMTHPQNSKLALKMFFNFYTMRGNNRYMKTLLVVFQK